MSAPILRQLENLEYKTPTPIQAACIPLLLQNKDLMGLAQTGTGKTVLIFALSADAYVEDKRLSRSYGMDGHFAKPVDFQKMKTEIGEIIRQKKR